MHRKNGKRNPYEVFIVLPALPLTFEGVSKARNWILRALDVLEKG